MARCKFFPVTYCDDPAVFLDQTQHDSLNSTQSWLHLLKLYPCPLHPYYWSHPTLTSSLFVRRVSSKWQDVLISLGWLDAISLCTLLFFFLFFFPCVFRPGVQQNALPASRSRAPALNWPLCLSPQIQIIKASAVPLCAVAMGTGGLRLPAGWVFALAANQSASGGGDAWGRVGGDAAWRGTVEVIQRLEVHRGFVPP